MHNWWWLELFNTNATSDTSRDFVASAMKKMTWPLKWRKKSKQSRAKRLETYESIIIKLSIWFCFETYLKRKKIFALLSLPWSRAHGSGFECSLRRSAMEVFLVFIHVLQIDRFNRRSGCNSTTRFHRNMRCDGRNVSVSVHIVHLLKLYLHPVPVCVCLQRAHSQFGAS